MKTQNAPEKIILKSENEFDMGVGKIELLEILAKKLGVDVKKTNCDGIRCKSMHYFIQIGGFLWPERGFEDPCLSREDSYEKIAVYCLNTYYVSPAAMRLAWGVKEEVEDVLIDQDGNIVDPPSVSDAVSAPETAPEPESTATETVPVAEPVLPVEANPTEARQEVEMVEMDEGELEEKMKEDEESEEEELKKLCAMECKFGTTVTTLGEELEKSSSYKELRKLCERLGVLELLKPKVEAIHYLQSDKQEWFFHFKINGEFSGCASISRNRESPVCGAARSELNRFKRFPETWMKNRGIPLPRFPILLDNNFKVMEWTEEEKRVAAVEKEMIEYKENGVVVRITLGEELEKNECFKKLQDLYRALGMLHELKYFIRGELNKQVFGFCVNGNFYNCWFGIHYTFSNPVTKAAKNDLRFYTVDQDRWFKNRSLEKPCTPVYLNHDWTISKFATSSFTTTEEIFMPTFDKPVAESVPARVAEPAPVLESVESDLLVEDTEFKKFDWMKDYTVYRSTAESAQTGWMRVLRVLRQKGDGPIEFDPMITFIKNHTSNTLPKPIRLSDTLEFDPWVKKFGQLCDALGLRTQVWFALMDVCGELRFRIYIGEYKIAGCSLEGHWHNPVTSCAKVQLQNYARDPIRWFKDINVTPPAVAVLLDDDVNVIPPASISTLAEPAPAVETPALKETVADPVVADPTPAPKPASTPKESEFDWMSIVKVVQTDGMPTIPSDPWVFPTISSTFPAPIKLSKALEGSTWVKKLYLLCAALGIQDRFWFYLVLDKNNAIHLGLKINEKEHSNAFLKPRTRYDAVYQCTHTCLLDYYTNPVAWMHEYKVTPPTIPVYLDSFFNIISVPVVGSVLPKIAEKPAAKPRLLQIVITTFTDAEYIREFPIFGTLDCRRILNATYFTRPKEEKDATLFIQKTLTQLYAKLHAEKSDVPVNLIIISSGPTLSTTIENAIKILGGDEDFSRKIIRTHYSHMDGLYALVHNIAAQTLSTQTQ